MIRFNNSINSKNKKLLNVFSNFIRQIFGGDRIKRLSNIIIHFSDKIYKEKNKKIKILDFGCGSMEISKKLKHLDYIEKIVGIDIHKSKFKEGKLEYLMIDEFFKKNKDHFDLIFAVDVLHHIGIDKANEMLIKLSKISDNLVIKDHFEHGFFSRQLLRFVDFYANYAFDVNIPNKYYDIKSWNETVSKSNLVEKQLIKNFQQHDGLFNFILNKKHHFVSHLKND